MSARPMRDRTAERWCDRAPSAREIAVTVLDMSMPLHFAEGTPPSVILHGEAA